MLSRKASPFPLPLDSYCHKSLNIKEDSLAASRRALDSGESPHFLQGRWMHEHKCDERVWAENLPVFICRILLTT